MKKAIIKKSFSLKKLKYQYYFVLKASNGEIIATSEMYVQKQSATKTLTHNFPDFKIINEN